MITQTVADTALALQFCCPIADMNRDPRCPRSFFTYMLHNDANELIRTQARIARTRSPYARANLTRWVAAREVELARLIDSRDQPCPDGQPDALTLDEILPSCSC